jgi:hypothetical protein
MNDLCTFNFNPQNGNIKISSDGFMPIRQLILQLVSIRQQWEKQKQSVHPDPFTAYTIGRSKVQ